MRLFDDELANNAYVSNSSMGIVSSWAVPFARSCTLPVKGPAIGVVASPSMTKL